MHVNEEKLILTYIHTHSEQLLYFLLSLMKHETIALYKHEFMLSYRNKHFVMNWKLFIVAQMSNLCLLAWEV